MRVAFVILTWNSENVISPCIKALFNYQKIQNEIVVVDNGSTDKTCSILEKLKKENSTTNHILKVIKLEKNFGTTMPRNLGVSSISSKNDYLCILDSDTVAEESAIIGLIEYLKKSPAIGLVGPKMLSRDGKIQRTGRNLPTVTAKFLKAFPVKSVQKIGEKMEIPADFQKECYPVGYLMSACWVMPLETWTEVGPLDEKIFYAPEDVDYCVRVWKAHKQVHYVGNVKIIHEWQRLSKKKFFSSINWQHLKGLMYYFKKHKYFFKAPTLDVKKVEAVDRGIGC